MATEPTEVLITGEATKVPDPFRALSEPDNALPSDVAFFEERITNTALAKTMLLSMFLMGTGALLCLAGLLLIFLPIVGIVFVVAGWVLLSSIKPAARAMREQERGNHTRLGVFILPGHVMVRTVMDYTIIPRARCGTLTADHKLVYFLGDVTKELRLPDELIDEDVSTMTAALNAWMRPSGQATGESASQ